MIERKIGKELSRLASSYPVVTITGPRQSGKSTLVKWIFPKKSYVSLEETDNRKLAMKDPRSFLARYPEGAIIDEVQRVPDLLSYIQTIVDENNKAGHYILTGSAQFELLSSITQSLAGRTALLRLLPLSISELYPSKHLIPELENILYSGFYPRIHNSSLNPREALGFYVSTYIDRDVRTLLNVKDLTQFETFLRLCASRTGQILNLNSLSCDSGINHNTAKSWLTILEASYIVFRLPQHYQNLNKRLIKSSKLYFYDVGLASYLLGIENSKQIATHPLYGALFETFVVSEMLKQRFNSVKESNLYYFRDRTGNEVDLILEREGKVFPIEIKAGRTFALDFFKGLYYYEKLNSASIKTMSVIYGGSESFDVKGNRVLSYRDIGEING